MKPASKSKRLAAFAERHHAAFMAYTILLFVLVLFAFNQNDFFTRYGPQSIFNQIITLAIASLAQTLVILTAGIDLSIGSIIGLTNSITATMMDTMIVNTGSQWIGIFVTIVVVLIVGAVAGLINGAIIVFGRLQPIIVTLATASIYGGIALYIRPIAGGKVPIGYSNFFTDNWFTYLPVSAVVLAVFIAFVWIPIRRSRLGQSVYAIGGNEYSAYVSGIPIERTKLLVYMLSGIVCACAGLLLTAQTSSGDPLGSSMFTLNSIAAVVLGGTALSGGKGGYAGSVAGAAILSLVLGLLIFWGVPSFYQDAVQGLILLFALVIGFVQRTRKIVRTG